MAKDTTPSLGHDVIYCVGTGFVRFNDDSGHSGFISDLIEVTVADPRIAIPASLISPTVAPRSAATVASGTPPIKPISPPTTTPTLVP